MRAAEGSHEVHRSCLYPYQCLFTFTRILLPLQKGDTESNCRHLLGLCLRDFLLHICLIHQNFSAVLSMLFKINLKTKSLLTTRDFINNKKNKNLLQINPASVLLNTLGELKFKPVLFSVRAAANTCT